MYIAPWNNEKTFKSVISVDIAATQNVAWKFLQVFSYWLSRLLPSRYTTSHGAGFNPSEVRAMYRLTLTYALTYRCFVVNALIPETARGEFPANDESCATHNDATHAQDAPWTVVQRQHTVYDVIWREFEYVVPAIRQEIKPLKIR